MVPNFVVATIMATMAIVLQVHLVAPGATVLGHALKTTTPVWADEPAGTFSGNIEMPRGILRFCVGAARRSPR